MPTNPVPPERMETDRLVVRRQQPDDASALARAVGDNLDHLRPWMPWATPESATEQAQRDRLSDPAGWDAGTDCGYVIWTTGGSDEATFVGCCGLHRRVGPGAIEIGYWIHKDLVGRGYATEAAGALTQAAWTMSDIDRVEIRCDEANARSAAVPPKLGYRLDRIVDDEVKAPGEVGRTLVWVLDRPPA